MKVFCCFGILLLAACGGSTPDAREPTSEPRHAEGPPENPPFEVPSGESLPHELLAQHVWRSEPGCTQGPVDLRFHPVGADRSERMDVIMCVPRGYLSGRYHTEIGDRVLHEADFGSYEDNTGCRATEVERARVASGEHVQDDGHGSDVPGGAAHGAPVEDSAAPPLVSLSDEEVDRCPPGAMLTVENHGWQQVSGGAPLNPADEIHVRIWFPQPVDLTGALFIVRQVGLLPSVTAEQWAAYRARANAEFERYRASADYRPFEEVQAPRAAAPASPPPPARRESRSPRPSDHAEWIPGYWHWNAETWAWLTGFWRVPEADVEAELTVRAPQLPPPSRAEQRPPQPDARAVWTEGHWLWDGRAFVWVTGGWQMPPRAGATWRAADWRRRGAIYLFVPGAWTVRVRP